MISRKVGPPGRCRPSTRSVSGHLRHELVCEALEKLPSGGSFCHIGGTHPIVLMEELLQRYGPRLAYRFVESDADHVVIGFTPD